MDRFAIILLSPVSDRAVRNRSRIVGGLLAVGVLAGVLTHAEDARAGWVWTALGAGCATKIATGPDMDNGSSPSSGYSDHPWVLGCPGGNPKATGPAGVYYLTWGGNGLIPTPKWNYDNFNAMSLYVNINGWVFATDTNGAVWEDVGNNGNPNMPYYNLPSGVWAKVAGGAVSNFAVTVQTDVIQNAGEMWYVDQYNYNAYQGEYSGDINIWGMGCGSQCAKGSPTSDASIWSIQSSNYVDEPAIDTSWAPMPGGAIQVTMVTSDGVQASGVDTLSQQTPWVLNAEGSIWVWNAYDGQNATYGMQGHWVNIPVPEPMVSITESGFALGRSGSVWLWNGTTSGGGTQSWSGWVAPQLNGNGATIALKQIAAGGWWPGAFEGGYGDLGGGEIWGIDYSGNIYFTVYESGGPIQ